MAGISSVSSVIRLELKQQTPMIHFQSKDPGACIRGSELKPRLVRFLLEKYRKSGKIDNKWVVKSANDRESLKMQVNVFYGLEDNRRPRVTEPKGQLFFGNQRSEDNEKEKIYQIMYEDDKGAIPVLVEITCLFSGLRKLIIDSAQEFFATTNFGTRTTKGYGSFSLEKINGENITEPIRNTLKDYTYFSVPLLDKETVEDKLADVAVVYSVLKGGINQSYLNRDPNTRNPELYVKGFIQMPSKYFCEYCSFKTACGHKCTNCKKTSCVTSGTPCNVASDKAFVKGKVFEPIGMSDEPKKPPKNYYYLRVLLGMAPTNLYAKGPRRGEVFYYNLKDIDVKVSIDSDGEETRIITDKRVKKDQFKLEIERVESPILVHIERNTAYFIFRPIPKELFGKWFYVVLDKKLERIRYQELIENSEQFVQVPESPIDWDVFIEQFNEYFDSVKAKRAVKARLGKDEAGNNRISESWKDVKLKLHRKEDATP